MGSWGLKGPELCRAIVPICTSLVFAGELLRRFALWAPPALSDILTLGDFAGHLPVLSLASVRDKLAWLRFAQNSWATRGRFAHNYRQCLVCGSHSDRLLHIICCRPFWRPVFAVLGVGGRRCTIKELLFSVTSAKTSGVGFRAHVALRGRPAASAAAWAEQVRAAAS